MYAYWVRCRYVVPLSITPEQYIGFEASINDLLGYDYYVLTLNDGVYSYSFINRDDTTLNQRQEAVLSQDVPDHPSEDSPKFIKIDNSTIPYADLRSEESDWMNEHVDLTETDKANDTLWCIKYNDYVSGDISIDDLKQFRTWFAESLFNIKTSWSEDEAHMLTYYINGMYDDALKWISICAKKTIDENKITGSACGCGGSDLTNLYVDSLHVCDPESIYKEGIKNIMITTFTNLDMWKELPTSFVSDVKLYIDGIISKNFPFNTFTNDSYAGCDCLNNYTAQEAAMGILKNLSNSLEYIATGSMDGHKNYILKSLNDWAVNLYEIMQWN